MKKSISRIFSWIFTIIMLFAIYKLFGIYKTYYFNGFVKAEANMKISQFIRDSEVKYSEDDSYKIVSSELNDATIYKEIQVEPNTPYRVTCMVKTENVIPENINTDGGACISIIEAPEISKSITGTNDWQQLELMFNSQKRTKVKIGFRLGGNYGSAKGTAWFSDFKLEKGINIENSTWKFACFIFENVDVNIDGEQMKFSAKLSDIESVRVNMQRFKYSCEQMSKNKMKVNYDIYNIKEPLTTISYSDEHGYYFDPYDVKAFIEDIVLENNYDYIFIAVKMGNNLKEIPVNNWVGLRKYGFIWNRIFKH